MGQSGKPLIATHSSLPGLSMATRKWGSNYFKGSLIYSLYEHIVEVKDNAGRL